MCRLKMMFRKDCPVATLLLTIPLIHTGDTGLRGPVGQAGIPGKQGAKGDQGDQLNKLLR